MSEGVVTESWDEVLGVGQWYVKVHEWVRAKEGKGEKIRFLAMGWMQDCSSRARPRGVLRVGRDGGHAKRGGMMTMMGTRRGTRGPTGSRGSRMGSSLRSLRGWAGGAPVHPGGHAHHPSGSPGSDWTTNSELN